jgi:hypothetical protein
MTLSHDSSCHNTKGHPAARNEHHLPCRLLYMSTSPPQALPNAQCRPSHAYRPQRPAVPADVMQERSSGRNHILVGTGAGGKPFNRFLSEWSRILMNMLILLHFMICHSKNEYADTTSSPCLIYLLIDYEPRGTVTQISTLSCHQSQPQQDTDTPCMPVIWKH